MSEDIEQLRSKLVARRADCLDRLEDAVVELHALHGLDGEDILERVRATLDKETRAGGGHAPAS